MTRPTGYAPELAEIVLRRIMDGEMLINVCAEDDMPTRDMFYGWMSGRPDLKQAYARARLAWADYWAEKVISISLDDVGDVFIDNDTGKAVADHARIQRHRLQADSIKWLVGKYAPRTYGDKPQDDAGEPKKLEISWQIERNIVRPGDDH